jgi:hypothetical protein
MKKSIAPYKKFCLGSFGAPMFTMFPLEENVFKNYLFFKNHEIAWFKNYLFLYYKNISKKFNFFYFLNYFFMISN